MMNRIFFLLPLIFAGRSALSQSKTAESDITTIFNRSSSPYIREKLYAHTDKDLYVPGEILWYRIYSLNGPDNTAGTLSKIAYAELLDNQNQPVIQEKVSLKPGESNGSFILPPDLTTGMYKFRVYTNWMKNFGAECFFEKPIRIINPQNSSSPVADSSRKRFDIQFFPEGGNLVQEIKCRVGFRITDAYGKGQPFHAVLLDSQGDTILRFQPEHFGIGSFSFTPLPGHSYKAIIRFPEGQLAVRELPGVIAGGFVMNLQKTSDSTIGIHVQASAGFENQTVYLFVHGSRRQFPVLQQELATREASFSVRLEDLESGISQCTVFNQSGQPVCERLFFRYPEKQLRITAETSSNCTTREKLAIHILTRDQSGKPITADLSMAVYRLDSLQYPGKTDIRSYSYLTSELGPVEDAAYYFDEQNASRFSDMDNLLLTQGWRRYDWNKIARAKPFHPDFLPEIDGHIIRAKVTDGKTGLPVPRVYAYLSIPSKRSLFRVATSNDSGEVKFEIPDFYGSQELIVQTNTAKDTTSLISLANPFSREYSEYALPASLPAPKNSADLLDQFIHAQVQRMYTGPKLNHLRLQDSDSSSFYVVPDEKYILDDYTRFITMEEVIREYVKSSNVAKRKGKFELYLLNNSNQFFFPDQPLILIDGVPFFDPNDFFQQDPKKISRLELVNREYFLGGESFQGILNANTYNGDLNGIIINPHAAVVDYPSIPEEREFFSPQYETESQISSHMPDFRTVLYWNPDVKSGSDGKESSGFYTSDLPGKYAIVIQGLSENGVPGSSVSFFTVKK